MRATLLLVLLVRTAYADDPCTAAKLGLAKTTEVALRVVGPSCKIRSTDDGIDRDGLRTTFPQLPKPGQPGYGSTELTLAVASAAELAAAVTCDGAVPAIDFTKDRAWVVVRDRLHSGATELVRGLDDGRTLVVADRTLPGCTGGAVYTFERLLVTTIVVAPADRSVVRRVCYVPQPPCLRNAK